ncbi:MAG: YqcC family protein [Pseudomonadota bacterium]
MSVEADARSLLQAVQAELERLELWENTPPPEEKLASTAPFAFDTLEFHQWLRWIFVPRTHALLDAGGRLPPNCDIAPMAEWYVEEKALETELVDLIKRFDALWG